MKHLNKFTLNLTLISTLLAGCADTPLQQADIEDREWVATRNTVQPPEPPKGDASDKSVRPLETSAPALAAPPVTTAQDAPKQGTLVSASADANISTAALSESDIAAKALAAAKAAQTSGVQTHGFTQQSPEGRQMEVAVLDGKDGRGGKNYAAPGVSHDAGPVLDPFNPNSPLAQRRILFDFDSAAIRDEYRTLLEQHAQYLNKEKSAKLILQGHADERGSREYNLALGQRRSESVYRALNLLGVPEMQMEAVSLGEEKPVAEGHEESDWLQNRRTEILYQGE